MKRIKHIAGIAALAGAALLAPSMTHAQSAPDCANSAACIVQVGNNNRATIDQVGAVDSSALVRIDGNRNGAGTIEGRDSGMLTSSTNSRLRVRGFSSDRLESGLVSQRGRNNDAVVTVAGNNNGFHIAQDGNSNQAVQAIGGNRNAAAAIQSGNRNELSQVQLGTDNFAYARQTGNNNTAVQTQLGSAESALLGYNAGAIAARNGTGTNNSILLEQNGGGNTAALAQVGSDHMIALRQGGDVTASITQLGANRSIAIDQTRGAPPVVVVQAGR
ncbi:hypothetical protein LQ953_10435 [Sphingomonas sp. IC-56]|uniref:hypothetical protein n=1 Tax=Sphingomonas sp. IC-56 TaxID=2898529 RepID=UPI001E52D729|nr:hypothetical protein [Sphingomonas sp. IC-56]MCD2324430.1 hypothetical protein [Sphingomonas sp. IC-56]